MASDRDNKGKFTKGNPGKPMGAKSERLKQWDTLGNSIIGEQAENFNKFLNQLWVDDGKELKKQAEDKIAAAELYLKVLEYFKPKLSRADVNQNNKHDFSQPIVIEKNYDNKND